MILGQIGKGADLKAHALQLAQRMAWAETSITTYSMPASAIWRKSRWKSTGSGVVRLEGIFSSPIIEHTVPINPVLGPAFSKIALTKKLVVVLPFGAGYAHQAQIAGPDSRKRRGLWPRADLTSGR